MLEGFVYPGSIQGSAGGSKDYKFHLGILIADSDLTITVTGYSDFNPDLYVNAGVKPSRDHYGWKSTEWGEDQIDIASSELSENTDYYIMVGCKHSCRFYIALSYETIITLPSGARDTQHSICSSLANRAPRLTYTEI